VTPMRDHQRAWDRARDAYGASDKLIRLIRPARGGYVYAERIPEVPGQFASLVIAVAKLAAYLDADELTEAMSMVAGKGRKAEAIMAALCGEADA
jgi:hypothetical protein